MDQRQELNAAQVLNSYSEERLHKLFERYGEVTNAITLAKTIAAERRNTSISTIKEFRNAVHGIVKGNPNKYFAQVFQALRIEVNDEFGALKEMLEQVPGVLSLGGRVAIITFHSIEDRIVKNFFKSGSINDIETDEVYGTKQVSPFEIITRKPITATIEETKNNSRARSAKLRIAEKK